MPCMCIVCGFGEPSQCRLSSHYGSSKEYDGHLCYEDKVIMMMVVVVVKGEGTNKTSSRGKEPGVRSAQDAAVF